MPATVKELLDKWAGVIGGRAWGADIGKPRIYINMDRRDVKAWFEFPDATPDWLGGAVGKIDIADCGQARTWYESQRAILTERLWRESLALDAMFAGDDALANDIMASDSDLTAGVVNGAARAMNNERRDEARQLLGLEHKTIER